MFGLGHWELIIILVIILIIFGAGKLPEIGGGMGMKIPGNSIRWIRDTTGVAEDIIKIEPVNGEGAKAD